MTVLPQQGYQGYGTPESIARKRRLAEQLMQGMSRAPRNVGEGLSALGNALAVRGINSRADKAEGAGRESATQMWNSTYGIAPNDGLDSPPSSELYDIADGTEPRPMGTGAGSVQANQGPSLQQLMALSANKWLTPTQRQIVSAQVMQALKGPEARSGVLGQYDQAKKEGFEGSLLDYQTQLANARRPTTTVSNTTINKGESEFAKGIAKGQAELFNGLAEAGINAQGELAQISELENLVASGVGGSGDAWKNWAQNNLGVQISGSSVEAFSALVNRLVPQQRPPGSGQMSDRDVQLFKESLPQLINSPEGNRLILETMRGMAEFKRAQGEIAQQVMLERLSREQGIEQLYALPDPMQKFRAARKNTLEALPDDELRNRLRRNGG